MAQALKLVVLGAGHVGKSSCTIQFVQGHFVASYDATVEDTYRKVAEVDGKACTLDIADTSGQEEYQSCVQKYCERGGGFLLVYSVVDKNSFQQAQEIYESLMRIRRELSPDSVYAKFFLYIS